MKFRNLTLIAVPLAAVAVLGLQLAGAQDKKDLKNIVDTAMGTGQHKTFCALITAAGLADELKKGEYTVFAPDDAAFDKLGKDTLANLQMPQNKSKLTDILKHHVVKGKHPVADIAKKKQLETLHGKVGVTVKDKDVMVGGAKITKADVMCSNGVIQVVDTVIMPKDDHKDHKQDEKKNP